MEIEIITIVTARRLQGAYCIKLLPEKNFNPKTAFWPHLTAGGGGGGGARISGAERGKIM